MEVDKFRSMPVKPIIPATITNGITLGIRVMKIIRTDRNKIPAIRATTEKAIPSPFIIFSVR